MDGGRYLLTQDFTVRSSCLLSWYSIAIHSRIIKERTSMHHLARNSLVLIASNIVGAVLGFALSLVIGRGLGEAGFGIWVFCLAWASILTMICEFGLNSLITREASRMPEKLNQWLILSLALKTAFIFIFGTGLWFLAPILA